MGQNDTIFNILDNTTELWMTKYIIGEIFSSGGATLYKNPSDQTVSKLLKVQMIMQLVKKPFIAKKNSPFFVEQ